MFTQHQIISALRRAESTPAFAARHDIPERTLYNLLLRPAPLNQPRRSTLKLVGAALEADGLLKARKKAK